MVYDIDSIKQRNSIADVITAHGVTLRESGTHLAGHCPFHEDDHPSFTVYPQTRDFYCSAAAPAATSSTSSAAQWPLRDFSESDLKLDLFD